MDDKKITVKSLVDLRKMLDRAVSIVACMKCLLDARGDVEAAYYLAKYKYKDVNNS